MASFFVYDLTFLVFFTLFIVWFLYKRRKNLQREAKIMFLYRTKFGITAIKYVGDKFKKTLGFLKYVMIVVGFFLMAAVLYLVGNAIYVYLAFPQITEVIKAPPIAPLIPYFPRIFGLESFFPPLYFTYFILALAIVAIVHEFSHGVFMRYFKIKIKSTGFAFLGPILGAFVEEDRKQFVKKKNSEQMAVLSAGVFANLVFALIFFVLLIGFFYISFVPSGYYITAYRCGKINVGAISGIGNLSDEFTEIYVGNKTYLVDKILKGQFEKNITMLTACEDSPSFREGLIKNIIIQAENSPIRSQEDFIEFLEGKKPGDRIELVTINKTSNEKVVREIVLGANPSDESKPYLGPIVEMRPVGIVGNLVYPFVSYKKPTTHYEPIWNGDLAWFIYYLFWWIAIINLFVALFNMLPLGILDGGRFFYLTILSITRSENFAKKSFKAASYLILFMFLLLMAIWLIRI